MASRLSGIIFTTGFSILLFNLWSNSSGWLPKRERTARQRRHFVCPPSVPCSLGDNSRRTFSFNSPDHLPAAKRGVAVVVAVGDADAVTLVFTVTVLCCCYYICDNLMFLTVLFATFGWHELSCCLQLRRTHTHHSNELTRVVAIKYLAIFKGNTPNAVCVVQARQQLGKN